MKKSKLPKILNCRICNSKSQLLEDWDFRGLWQIECSKQHKCPNKMVGFNHTQNRAIHKWNNKQLLIDKVQTNQNVEIRLKNSKPTKFMQRIFNMCQEKEVK